MPVMRAVLVPAGEEPLRLVRRDGSDEALASFFAGPLVSFLVADGQAVVYAAYRGSRHAGPANTRAVHLADLFAPGFAAQRWLYGDVLVFGVDPDGQRTHVPDLLVGAALDINEVDAMGERDSWAAPLLAHAAATPRPATLA